jgi:hypothetical protein
MLRRALCAGFVLLAVGGIVLADTIRGVITAANDKEITVNVREKGKRGKGTEKTFKVSADTKIFKAAGKDSEPTKVSSSDFQKAVKDASKAEGRRKGVFATLEVEGENVTKITYGGGGRRGKGKRTKE